MLSQNLNHRGNPEKGGNFFFFGLIGHPALQVNQYFFQKSTLGQVIIKQSSKMSILKRQISLKEVYISKNNYK